MAKSCHLKRCACFKCCGDKSGFNEILNFINSGLVIYHTNRPGTFDTEDKSVLVTPTVEGESFILVNTSNITVNSADVVRGIETKNFYCPRCRYIAEHIQKMLPKIPPINSHDILGICDHCLDKQKSCFHCEKAVQKFISTKHARSDKYRQYLKSWLNKVKKMLKVSNGNNNDKYGGMVRSYSEIYIDQLIRNSQKSLSLTNYSKYQSSKRKTLDPRFKIIEFNDAVSFGYDDRHIKIQSKNYINMEHGISIEECFQKNQEAKGNELKTILKQKNYPDSPLVNSLRRYCSVESIFTTVSGITKVSDVDDDFLYFFPKDILDSPTKRQLFSSTELIKETQELLSLREKVIEEPTKKERPDKKQKLANEKIQPSEELKKKLKNADVQTKTKELKNKQTTDDEDKKIDSPKTVDKSDKNKLNLALKGKQANKKDVKSNQNDEKDKNEKISNKNGVRTESKDGKERQDVIKPLNKNIMKKEPIIDSNNKGSGSKDKGKDLKQSTERNITYSKDENNRVKQTSIKESINNKGRPNDKMEKEGTSPKMRQINKPVATTQTSENPKKLEDLKPKDIVIDLKSIENKMKEANSKPPPAVKDEKKITPEKIDTSGIEKYLKKNSESTALKERSCPLCIVDSSEFNKLAYKKDEAKVRDVIVGKEIVKQKPNLFNKDQEYEGEIVPLHFITTYDVNDDNIKQDNVVNETKPTNAMKPVPEKDVTKGVIHYALSDPTFIEKGWTLLPTNKIVRKINVYRMRPAHPEFDWFQNNKSKGLMTYDTGEKLAEFDDNGCGRWYYRNGRLALNYYEASEVNAQQRIIVYSNGESDERGRPRPYAVLAMFDFKGNGVVFDHTGKIRMKYNQTEGVVLDRNIGPVSQWKWHTLNDPPVLQQVMIDTQMPHKDETILNFGGGKPLRRDNEDMLAIEFDNFIKENKKLTQAFKPFQIRMKSLKVNENFSLKVLDQANVYLIFRDGKTHLKLNIGMVLDHKEIIDTDTEELGEVANSLERFPACTESINALQENIAKAQRIEKKRNEHERRLLRPEPRLSVDKMTAAASRPLHPPLRTVTPCKYSRKPSCCEVYYDTRLY